MAGLEQLPIENQYSNISDLIAMAEHSGTGDYDTMARVWALFRILGTPMSCIITALKQTLESEPLGTRRRPICDRALLQIDHPEFRQYVKAKLGQM